MFRFLKICFLLISVNHAEITHSQNSEDLPPLLHKAVEEIIAGKYLNALLDILNFQSSNVWTADTLTKVMAYFHAREVMFTLSSLQVSIKSYLKNLLYQPRQLLSEFQQLDQQQFQTAMKCLFNSRKDHLEIGNIILDWDKTRERIFQSPGVNRTLFLVTLDKCFLALSPLDCVDILSQVLHVSAVNYLQPDVIGSLPNVLLEDAFRNLSTVFKDLYDRTSSNTQRAVYGWMKQILQKSCNVSALGPPGEGISLLQKQHLPHGSLAEKKLVMLMEPLSKHFSRFWCQRARCPVSVVPAEMQRAFPLYCMSPLCQAAPATGLLMSTYLYKTEFNESTSWVSAENLWILGRYMVHLPLEEILKIRLSEIRLFISYDNATKQLDAVYDITPELAQAFLERINSSGFDMRNTSTIYRLGLLVCFYDDMEQTDAAVARALLHQMIKCNQLRGFQAEVQKLKSQLLNIAIQNQTLNYILGSLSDAVIGLTSSQLESLSPEAVHNAIATLSQVSGWAKSQVMVLSSKYLSYEKVLSFYNVSQMGALVTGISTQSFYSMNPKELSQIIRGTTSQYLSDLSPAQQQGILRKIAASGDFSSSVKDIQGAFFKEISLSNLWKQTGYNSSVMKGKELRSSQALYLYELLSKKNYPVDILSTGQLVKGVTCQLIENMGTDFFLNNFKLFENNLHLLSPYQVNCLAWKFWKVSNVSIPPFLLLVLPLDKAIGHSPSILLCMVKNISLYLKTFLVEYLEYVSDSLCVPFIESLGKTEMDLLNPSLHKKNTVLQKVQECLNGSIADEYDVDLLGNLICHLPPAFLHDRMSPRAMATALHQFKLCRQLSHEQKTEIKYKLLELYGSPNNWTAETTLDVGPFIALLSKGELNVLAEKFPNIILQIAKAVGPISSAKELLSTVFESISNATANIESSLTRPDCMGTRAPSSDEIIKLAEANVFWSVQELQCMDMGTFEQNVDLLGTVSGFNSSQLIALKEKAKQVWGSLPGWKSYHIVSLGRIALALTEREIEELDLHSIDTISVLSQQTEWTLTQLAHLMEFDSSAIGNSTPVSSAAVFPSDWVEEARSILRGFLEDSGQTINTLKSFDLVGFGAILCALNSTEIMSIRTAEFSAAVARIGLLFCSTPVLRQFKKVTESVFGTATSWNGSILQEIGAIAGGLNEDELKAFDKNLMPYFQPIAIRCMPPEVLQALSPEQIANLGPENAAMVTRSQREHLNASQLQSLQLALDGDRTSTPETQHGASTTQAVQTPAPSGAPCLSGFGICLCAVFMLSLPF